MGKKFTRGNKEKEKKGGRGFTRFPDDNRYKCRVQNLESPGDNIVGNVNGVRFEIQDGSTVLLHKSQIEVLRNSIIETSEHIETVNGYQVRPVRKPRHMVEVLDMTPVTREKPTEVVKPKESNETPSPSEHVPGATAEGQQVVSGRL